MTSNGILEAELPFVEVLPKIKRSAAAFRKTETVTLPSGLEVEARKIDVLRLIAEAPEDSVPAFLVAQFSGALGDAVKPLEAETPSETLRKMSRFMDMTVKAAVVWPVIVDTPTAEDEIAISDLDMSDRQALFTWVMPQTKAE